MAAPKVVHGARAVVRIASAGANAGTPVGIFSNFGYGLTYDVQPAFILGRFSAAELGYTGVEPVRCTATGWRVVNSGPHIAAQFPRVQDLLQHEYIQIDVVDRQTNKVIAIIKDVRPESYSSTIATKALTEVTHTFIGLLMDDESVDNVEGGEAAGAPSAPDLPPVLTG
jgi:hypothetical protein